MKTASLALALSLSLFASAPAAQEAVAVHEPAWTAQDQAAIELLRGLRSREQEKEEAVLAERLAQPGGSAWPLLLDVLVARRVPSFQPDTEPQVLSEVQERVILRAIGTLERDFVLERIAALGDVKDDQARTLAVMGCMGAVGRVNDLLALFELARPERGQAPDRDRAAALRRAAAAIVVRDERSFEQLVALRRLTPVELLPALIKAVGDARDGRGLRFLSDVAYWHEDLVADVLAQVRRVGPSGDADLDDAMRVRIRPYLDPESPSLCRAAIPALVALSDSDSLGPLIELLEHESRGLRQDAHWALRQLTGLELSASPETWGRWYQAEQAWLIRERPRTFQRLRSNEAGVAAAALREVLEHPLARQELCEALPDLLRNRVPAIRAMACEWLADLEVASAVPKLVWALDDRDRDVSRAAWQALRHLTALDLPLESDVWREELGEQVLAAGS
jgi:hypothetical protein